MTEIPPNQDETEVNELYRRVSALDTGGPSESVRRAVLEHAANLASERGAADRALNNVVSLSAAKRPAQRPTWWKPAALGTLAAASLAGLLIAPQFLTPQAPSRSASAPAVVAPPPPSASEPRAKMPDEAPAADQAADIAADSATGNAPARRQNAAKLQAVPAASSKPSARDELVAQGAAGANAEMQSDSRRARTQSSGAAVASAPATTAISRLTPAPMAAARVVDASAELRRAAEIGDVPALQALLDQEAVIDARDASGRTSLMLATLHGRTEAVEVLLAAGADPNAADARGTTPLQAAMAGNQSAIVAALRRAGAR